MNEKGFCLKQEELTGIQFKILSSANEIITLAARKNIRSKRSESKLRLKDHCERFPVWSKIEFHEKEVTSVGFMMDSDINDVITKSAKRNAHSKRNEAKLRLADHCAQFPSWQPS